MTVEISTEIEARLLAKAREQGLSVEALLDRFLAGSPDPKRNGEARELPRWNLGAKGSLRRREIYGDAR